MSALLPSALLSFSFFLFSFFPCAMAPRCRLRTSVPDPQLVRMLITTTLRGCVASLIFLSFRAVGPTACRRSQWCVCLWQESGADGLHILALGGASVCGAGSVRLRRACRGQHLQNHRTPCAVHPPVSSHAAIQARVQTGLLGPSTAGDVHTAVSALAPRQMCIEQGPSLSVVGKHRKRVCSKHQDPSCDRAIRTSLLLA